MGGEKWQGGVGGWDKGAGWGRVVLFAIFTAQGHTTSRESVQPSNLLPATQAAAQESVPFFHKGFYKDYFGILHLHKILQPVPGQ